MIPRGAPRRVGDTYAAHRLDRHRGQALVEFALLVPVMLLMLLVVLDFGRLFMSYITLTNQTRVAANYGATNPSAFTGTPNTTTYDALVASESAGLNCDLQPDSGGHNPPLPTFPNGTGLNATSVAAMTCRFSLLTPFMTDFFGGPVALSARAEFPIRTGAISNVSGPVNLPPPGGPQAGFDFTGVSGGAINGSGDVTGIGTVTVNVNDTSVNAQTWDWDWGDGSAHEFTSSPVAHTYTSSSTFTVRLTVTNTVGSSVTSRRVIVTPIVVPPPVAGFYGTPVGTAPQVGGGGSGGAAIFGSYPLVVNFTNLSSGASAYSWDFGDGTAGSTMVSPQHQYSALGIFMVTLSITTPTGGTPFTRTDYVTTGCVVPNFANTSTSAAQATWTSAHFTGTITYQPVGANGNSQRRSTPPGVAKNIVAQEGGTGGDFKAPTRQNQSSPWECGDSINLRYTP